jgi:hypothetical protein
MNNSLTCKIWGFHGGDYDDYHLLGDDNHQQSYVFMIDDCTTYDYIMIKSNCEASSFDCWAYEDGRRAE